MRPGKFKFSLIILLIWTSARAQPIALSSLRPGDLLFLDLDCGPMCDAIEEVTPAWNGMHFSHVGILISKNDSLFVLEALPPGVKLTPINKFMAYSSQPMAAGRWNFPFDTLIDKALLLGQSLLGQPYDSEFRMGNGKWYCSELVYEIFKTANRGNPVFNTAPMTYCRPGKKEIHPIWKAHFSKLQVPVPEGEPGCNPGNLALSPSLNMLGVVFPQKQ
jgi:hypothetical protein